MTEENGGVNYEFVYHFFVFNKYHQESSSLAVDVICSS